MNIYEKLAAVQQELKAPKDKYNKFGGYNYRSAEGILEAVKPVLTKHGALIAISDDITETGGRIYVKATATFLDQKDGGAVQVTAYAREAEQKKGMDESQITGTASSYARKYALNGLLLIDDTKDADTDEYQVQTAEPAEPLRKANELISQETEALIVKMASDAKVDLGKILTKPLNELTNQQAGSLMEALKKRIGG